MLEPPSPDLVRRLTELQLCRPGDLRRARGRVRRLAHDLPAFDSVWIDSLVQLRLLTPYQAKRFEEGQADQLRIGSLVIIEEWGRSDRGTTLLARPLNQRDRCVVKRLRIPADRLESMTQQTLLLLERGRGFAHPHLVLPREIISSTSQELVVVSRLVPGLPLNELLVRRGRFPAGIVLDIGRQLLEGLAALHQRSLLHGDIRMSNVRLTDNGLAVLVDGGLRQVLHPELTIHDQLALEAYDGLAPELIGTGVAASAGSELYAVGCLLWQLLAGRPPFITADPLAKMAAHQTQTIEDVRTLAPDTPALLADMIRQMTAPSPQERPRGFDAVLQRWGRAGSFGRARLKHFRRLFNTAVPHFSAPAIRSGQSHWIWLGVLAMTALASVATYHDHRIRGELLAIMQKVQSSTTMLRDSTSPNQEDSSPNPGAVETSKPEKSTGRLRSLPKPSADGVVVLNERGPYAAGTVTFAGTLTIRSMNGVGTEIVVDEDPLGLTAQTVELDHVTLRSRGENRANFLAKLHCQELYITNCEFVTNAPESTQGRMGLAWKPFDRAPKSGAIVVKNSIFRGSGSAILLAQPPRSIQLVNLLKTGHGALLSMGPKSSQVDCQLELDRVTLRQSGPLVRLAGEYARTIGIAPFQIQAAHCIFDLAEPRAGFVTVDSDQPRRDVAKSVEMKAIESFISPGTSLLVTCDDAQNHVRDEDADEQFEGLDVGEVQFAGTHVERSSDSRAIGLKGPRRATDKDLPGVELRHLGPSVRSAGQQQTERGESAP